MLLPLPATLLQLALSPRLQWWLITIRTVSVGPKVKAVGRVVLSSNLFIVSTEDLERQNENYEK
jgi:hypothetical protein